MDETEGFPHKAKRQDTCVVILSGVVGTDAQEFYLRDGHYRQIFPVSRRHSIKIILIPAAF